MKKFAIFGLIAGALLFSSCNKKDADSDSESTATETGTTAPVKTPEQIDAARTESVKESLSAKERRQEFIAAFQDPSSKIYSDAAEHVKTLKKMASEDPVAFRRLLDQVNSLRFSRGLTELTAEALTGASLKAAVAVVEEPEAIAQAPKVAACIKARMAAGAPAGGGADGGWQPGQACPNNCVCSAAAFVAVGFGVGQATAQCASGETVTAFAYAYAYAAAYAFAYACAPEPPPAPVCGDPAPQPEECLDVDPGADPLVPFIVDNPGCLDTGKCGEPVPVEPTDTGSGMDTGTGPSPNTTTDVSTNPSTDTTSDTGTGAGSGTEGTDKLPSL